MPGPGTYKVYSEFGDPDDYKKRRVYTEANNSSTIKEDNNKDNEGNDNANETTQDNNDNNVNNTAPN